MISPENLFSLFFSFSLSFVSVVVFFLVLWFCVFNPFSAVIFARRFFSSRFSFSTNPKALRQCVILVQFSFYSKYAINFLLVFKSMNIYLNKIYIRKKCAPLVARTTFKLRKQHTVWEQSKRGERKSEKKRCLHPARLKRQTNDRQEKEKIFHRTLYMVEKNIFTMFNVINFSIEQHEDVQKNCQMYRAVKLYNVLNLM